MIFGPGLFQPLCGSRRRPLAPSFSPPQLFLALGNHNGVSIDATIASEPCSTLQGKQIRPNALTQDAAVYKGCARAGAEWW